MASPIYFFPGVRRDQIATGDVLAASFLEGRGAGPAFAGVRLGQCNSPEIVGRGPGGHSGVMLQTNGPAGEVPLRIGYHPDFQTWHERPCGCDVWVGVDRDFPPTPDDLARVRTPRGYAVELGDGFSKNTWMVPVVRSVEPARSQIEHAFGYDAAGRFAVTRSPAADELWAATEEAWNHWFDNEQHPTVSLERMVDLVLGALGLNYRVGRIEQQVLGLVNTTNWATCVEALLDVPLVMERIDAQKKTRVQDPAPGSSSASPGAAGYV